MDTNLPQLATVPSAVVIALTNGPNGASTKFDDMLKASSAGQGSDHGPLSSSAISAAALNNPIVAAIGTSAIPPTSVLTSSSLVNGTGNTPSVTVLTSTDATGQQSASVLLVSNTQPDGSTDGAAGLPTSFTVVKTSTDTANMIADIMQSAPLTASTDGTVGATIVFDQAEVGEAPSVEIETDSRADGGMTIHIKVSDLQAMQADDLSTKVIEAGADYRRQLFQSLGSAFQLLSAGNATSGVDYVTSVVLAQQGLRPDDTGSISPLDTYDGGAQCALASTYIGQVVPPQLDELLMSLGASDDFVAGYNSVRQTIIDVLQDRFACNPVDTGPGSADASKNAAALGYPLNANDLSRSDFFNLQEASTAFGFASFSQTVLRHNNSDRKKDANQKSGKNRKKEEDQDEG